MRIYLTSYATPRFEEVRRDLNASAVAWNIRNILSYEEADLHGTEFYRDNRSILDEVCGAGYWAWKPFFILQALSFLAEGDVLFYCDAGSKFISSPQPLIDLCRSNAAGLLLFDARPLTNRQFTKRDCFVRLECDQAKHWDAVKVIATILVVRKSAFTVEFIGEWLRHCQDRAALTEDENCCGQPNLPEFLQHRWDQAILSVLASKHHLETYRNPTIWGNYLKMPAFRVAGEPVVSPYGLVPEIKDYASTPQTNSLYGTIFEINRLPNFVGKKSMPVIKRTEDGRAGMVGRLMSLLRFRIP